MAALTAKRYDGRNLKVGRRLGDFGSYTRSVINYRGDGLTISGIMNVPKGKGARATVDALEKEGKDVTLRTYRGEGHTSESQWRTSIERTEAFFARHLG